MGEEINTRQISDILNNEKLIAWARKTELGEIQANKQLKETADKFHIAVKDTSVGIFDKSLVKVFVSEGQFNGTPHTSIGLKQLEGVMRALGSEGKLIICSEPNSPVVIAYDKGTVALAPVVDELEEKPKEEKAKKEPKPIDADDDESTD